MSGSDFFIKTGVFDPDIIYVGRKNGFLEFGARDFRVSGVDIRDVGFCLKKRCMVVEYGIFGSETVGELEVYCSANEMVRFCDWAGVE